MFPGGASVLLFGARVHTHTSCSGRTSKRCDRATSGVVVVVLVVVLVLVGLVSWKSLPPWLCFLFAGVIASAHLPSL